MHIYMHVRMYIRVCVCVCPRARAYTPIGIENGVRLKAERLCRRQSGKKTFEKNGV